MGKDEKKAGEALEKIGRKFGEKATDTEKEKKAGRTIGKLGKKGSKKVSETGEKIGKETAKKGKKVAKTPTKVGEKIGKYVGKKFLGGGRRTARGRGWYGESGRHYLAQAGIETAKGRSELEEFFEYHEDVPEQSKRAYTVLDEIVRYGPISELNKYMRDNSWNGKLKFNFNIVVDAESWEEADEILADLSMMSDGMAGEITSRAENGSIEEYGEGKYYLSLPMSYKMGSGHYTKKRAKKTEGDMKDIYNEFISAENEMDDHIQLKELWLKTNFGSHRKERYAQISFFEPYDDAVRVFR